MYKYKFNLIFIFMLMSSFSHANYIPKEFEHFYEFEVRNILFELPNDTYYKSKASANYYGINKIEGADKFISALVESGIKKSKTNEVLAVILGENTSNKKIKLIYSYSKATFLIEVSSDYMDENYEKRNVGYTSLHPDASALIISNRAYSSYYDKDLNITLTQNGILGLGKGYLETSYTIFTGTSTDSDFTFNDASYEYNFEGYKFKTGYSSYGVVKDNSTSFLDFSRSKDSYYVSLSSSDNLLLVNDSKHKQLYFDIKSTGTVDVIRDGKTLFSQSYYKGQHSISYSQLPRGNYDVLLRIRAKGYAEELIIKRISNNTSTTTHKGYDFNITLRQSAYSLGRKDYNLIYEEMFFTKSFFSDSLLLGANTRSDGDSIDLGTGVNYSRSNLNSSVYYNKLLDGQFIQMSLNLFGFNFDYEKLNMDDTRSPSNLLATVYGSSPYHQVSLSYSFPLLTGNISLYGSKLERERTSMLQGRDSVYSREKNDINTYDSKLYRLLYFGEINSTNLAVNYNTNLYKNISLDLGYSLSMNDHENKDGVFSVAITIPLGDNKLTYSSHYESSTRNKGRISNTLNYQENDLGLFSSVNSSGGAGISNYIDGIESETSVNGYINLDNDHFVATGYGDYSSQGYNNLSMTFDSTSIITTKDILQYKNFYPSYLVVNSKDNSNQSADVKTDFGAITIQINNSNYMDEMIKGENTVIGLDYFKSYNFNIDNEISGFQTRNEEKYNTEVMYSYPGSIHKINNEVEKVSSFLRYFEDFNDKPLNNVKCIGEGCVSINSVGDGIYSLKIIKNKPFNIVSNGEICYVNPDEMESDQAKSRCFPTIEEGDRGMQLVSSGLGNKGDLIYYLGVINNKIPKKLLLTSDNENIKYIKRKFAQKTHLFVKVKARINDGKGVITLAQRDIIDKLQLYVNSDSSSTLKDNSFALN